MTSLDNNAYFVCLTQTQQHYAHTLLSFLEKHPAKALIVGYILVSGFNECACRHFRRLDRSAPADTFAG
ncbi:MAG: hypothetical protein ACR5K7_03215 [Symbiopectobacterium sp.]